MIVTPWRWVAFGNPPTEHIETPWQSNAPGSEIEFDPLCGRIDVGPFETTSDGRLRCVRCRTLMLAMMR